MIEEELSRRKSITGSTTSSNNSVQESNSTSKLSGCETDSLVKEAVSYPDCTPVASMTHEHQGEIADTDRRR